jgi:hypothetical protein
MSVLTVAVGVLVLLLVLLTALHEQRLSALEKRLDEAEEAVRRGPPVYG